MEAKDELRKVVKIQRDALTKEEQEFYAVEVNNRLWQLITERKAKVIHSFLPMGSEINIIPVLEMAINCGKTIVAPKTFPGRLLQHLVLSSIDAVEQGIYGTIHPKNGKVHQGGFDLIIVPGLVFDHDGNRIGYGAGYYDAFMAAHPEAYKVAAGYPFQLKSSVPSEPHDIKVDEVIC